MENETRPAGGAADRENGAVQGRRASDSTLAPKNQAPTLRPYQVDIIEQAAKLERPLIPLPTGAGKTVIASAIIEAAIRRGLRVLFVVHRRELVIQASGKLLAVGVDHAILMGPESSEYIGQRCIVASNQTLYARAFRNKRIELPKADLIFFDEAHHCRARTYVEIRKAYPHAKIIGLSATPARGDGLGLGGDLFSDLVKVPTYAELIDHKYLVPPIVYAPVVPDLKGVRTLDTGDYSPSELEERMNTNRLVGGVVEHWHKLGENRPTIVFTTGVKHSVHLRDEFRTAGVAAEHIDAKTPLPERKRIIADFKTGIVKVLCNCMIFTEGFDEPSASCLILARPTKLLTMYRQMAGRVLRPHPDKADAIVLDHSGAVYRHGYPDDEIQWVLSSDEKAVNKSAKARGGPHGKGLCECPKCGAIRNSGEECWHCGWKPETKPKYLGVVDGSLGQVRRDRSAHEIPRDELVFYREIKGIFEEKRRRKPDIKSGYPAVKFKEKTGRWPPDHWRNLEPLPPSPATRSWVRDRENAWRASQPGARP